MGHVVPNSKPWSPVDTQPGIWSSPTLQALLFRLTPLCRADEILFIVSFSFTYDKYVSFIFNITVQLAQKYITFVRQDINSLNYQIFWQQSAGTFYRKYKMITDFANCCCIFEIFVSMDISGTSVVPSRKNYDRVFPVYKGISDIYIGIDQLSLKLTINTLHF